MDTFKAEIVRTIEEVICILSATSTFADQEMCALRLEMLTENAMTAECIPLKAVDLLIQAVNIHCWKREDI